MIEHGLIAMGATFSRVALFSIVAAALLLSAPSTRTHPGPSYCPDPGPDPDGFVPCPCPPCMAPCVFMAEPQGECKGPDGSVAETTFTCCCCGGSVGWLFRFFTPYLDVERVADESRLTWTEISGAESFDIVGGDLASLRDGEGDFGAATTNCIDDNRTVTSLMITETPAPGQALWFLIRGEEGGTYDSARPSQVASRDDEIAASGNDCP
jgi:hypothetical protein